MRRFAICGLVVLWVVGALGPANSEIRCLPGEDGAAETALREIRAELLACAACAPAYFAKMTVDPPELCLDDNPLAPRGAYEPEQHRITLNANLTRGEQLLVALHEVRHLDQMARGLCPSPQMSQDAYVEAKLALEADAMANAVALAWSLRGGRQDVWHAAQTMTRYDDIAASFAEKMDGGASLPDAVSAAYTQWYASPWRVETYRQSACVSQLDQQDAQHLLPLYAPLPGSFFDVLCTLPDGRAYTCARPD
ncbi:MAG: hypothetical protein QNI90_06010 [Dinoroseobacter sp.]|nr:hypothetical protein [Dinoroseobacter sp.]